MAGSDQVDRLSVTGPVGCRFGSEAALPYPSSSRLFPALLGCLLLAVDSICQYAIGFLSIRPLAGEAELNPGAVKLRPVNFWETAQYWNINPLPRSWGRQRRATRPSFLGGTAIHRNRHGRQEHRRLRFRLCPALRQGRPGQSFHQR